MCRKEALLGPSSWKLVRHLIEGRWGGRMGGEAVWAGSLGLQAGLEEADNSLTEHVLSPNTSPAE